MVINIISWVIGVIGAITTIISLLQRKRRVITISETKSINVNSSNIGSFEFDYSNFDGIFVIGKGDYQFDTKWSRASNTHIHAVSDCANIEAIGLIKDDIDLTSIKSIECDFTSRCRCPQTTQSIVWKNKNGHYAITKITKIQDSHRGDTDDLLKCDYIVLEDK